VLAVQRDGYWRNAERNRERAREYAAAHREEARERAQSWKRANPARAVANSRLDKRRRRLDRDPDAYEYAEQALRYDPCAYCNASAETIDHIEPLSAGVNNDWLNLTASCGACNSSKHDSRLLLFLHRRATGAPDPMRQRARREVSMTSGLSATT
jgi:5-methylcytosine-specific restriction endonuclease McrA